MKRLFTLIVAISSIFAAMAQNPMVTLSHNGELTFFTNIGAFNSAVEAAEQGDILYISEGSFVLNEGVCDISKRLSVIGSGYKTHILGTINFQGGAFDKSVKTNPIFEGVRLDNLNFYCNPADLGDTEIVRCWIRKITNGDSAATNIMYDKCYLEDIHFGAGLGHGNVVLKNTKIGHMENCADVTTINCNISEADYYPRYMLSSILGQSTSPKSNNNNPTAENSLFMFDLTNDDVTFFKCYTYNMNSAVMDSELNTQVDLVRYGYRGADGKEVGIRGGDSPFSENPSVPTVDTANSSVDYDAASNKLKVSITVKAD